jgi:hypothetical protein
MTPSIPCAKCGQIDDLETVNPLGIHLDKVVIWNCRCNNTRAVEMSHHIPQELVRKAVVMNERINRLTAPCSRMAVLI